MQYVRVTLVYEYDLDPDNYPAGMTGLEMAAYDRGHVSLAGCLEGVDRLIREDWQVLGEADAGWPPD